MITTWLQPAAALLAFCPASCATSPSVPPDWVTQGVPALYPAEKFIAQEGRGETRKSTKTDALVNDKKFIRHFAPLVCRRA
jgi:hypothetical protein